MSSANSACHCAVRTVTSGAGVRQQGLRLMGISETLKNDRHIANAHVGFGVRAAGRCWKGKVPREARRFLLED